MERGIGSNRRSSGGDQKELFHVLHKVPAGDSPYVWAKHLQLVEKDQDSAIIWFWKAINAGDRIDSALKDMVVIMKQQGRAEEAIEAIKSFRHLCSRQAQESLDNLLVDLYKIELLKQKLRMLYLGEAFNGKTTKIARSHGKKFQVNRSCAGTTPAVIIFAKKYFVRSQDAELDPDNGRDTTGRSRSSDLRCITYFVRSLDAELHPDNGHDITGRSRSSDLRFITSVVCVNGREHANLGWAYMQQNCFDAAELVYRQAQMVDPDANKACNLGVCLMRQGNFDNARSVLLDVVKHRVLDGEEWKAVSRATELLREIELKQSTSTVDMIFSRGEDIDRLDNALNGWCPSKSRRLPIFEEISTYRDQIAC